MKCFIAQTDPWQNYGSGNSGFGTGHNFPVVPEPSYYGSILLILSFGAMCFRKFKK